MSPPSPFYLALVKTLADLDEEYPDIEIRLDRAPDFDGLQVGLKMNNTLHFFIVPIQPTQFIAAEMEKVREKVKSWVNEKRGVLTWP